jgi:DNA-binding NarL/FixJ family response regulator
MREQNPDLLRAVFDRAAERLRLSGRRREIGWLYFRGEPVKAIRLAVKITEGTMKREFVSLHALSGTSNRAEFVHRIYENGAP